MSPPPPSPNQSYQGSGGYNFRPTDARCLPRSVLLRPPTRRPPGSLLQSSAAWAFLSQDVLLFRHQLSDLLLPEPFSGAGGMTERGKLHLANMGLISGTLGGSLITAGCGPRPKPNKGKIEPLYGCQCYGGVGVGWCLSSVLWGRENLLPPASDPDSPLPTAAVPSGCSLPSTPLPALQGPLRMVNPQTGEILPACLSHPFF